MVNLSHVPKNPGCYLFKDSKGKVIYVGKAKNLAKRVKSYFQKTHEDIKTNVLVSRINSVEFVITDSEVEALILENNLIKKYKPRYNIDLKDSKRYAYIEVTGEDFPRLLIARSKSLKGKGRGDDKASKFYGPFVSGLARDYVLRVLRNTFKIRTCRALPKKRCMRFEIGLCSAPCEGLISQKDYCKDVDNCRKVLRGNTKGLIEVLNKKMEMFSRDQEFEKALILREQIRAIKKLGEKQKMEREKKYDEDFINWIVHDDKVYLILFNSKKGILENKQFFEFDYSENFLEEFLVQFYNDYEVPKEVILPLAEDKNIYGESGKISKGLRDFLKEKGGSFVFPVRGEKKKLLELVRRNVEISVFGNEDKVRELGEKLKLPSKDKSNGDFLLPRVIECFDVSHLSGTDVVASMVQFRGGKADKSNYRKFKIRGGDKNDDCAAMREVMTRRYKGLKARGLSMPDLIVVDGGKGQLGIAVEVLKKLNLDIAVIGLAKAEETVFFPKKSEGIRLDKRSGALKLLVEIRDEAHRFAISYQRLLRSKRLKG